VEHVEERVVGGDEGARRAGGGDGRATPLELDELAARLLAGEHGVEAGEALLGLGERAGGVVEVGLEREDLVEDGAALGLVAGGERVAPALDGAEGRGAAAPRRRRRRRRVAEGAGEVGGEAVLEREEVGIGAVDLGGGEDLGGVDAEQARGEAERARLALHGPDDDEGGADQPTGAGERGGVRLAGAGGVRRGEVELGDDAGQGGALDNAQAGERAQVGRQRLGDRVAQVAARRRAEVAEGQHGERRLARRRRAPVG
jgi:hypothetical protein